MASVDDYNFEGADAGGSDTIPIEAGQIKKGGHMVIKGRPCKVSEVSHSKTGKHGSAKCNFSTYDIFTNKKLEDMQPSSANMYVPIITRTEYTLIDIKEDGELSLMDEDGGTREDLNLPAIPEGYSDELRGKFDDGKELVLTVLKSMGEEMVIADKEATDAE